MLQPWSLSPLAANRIAAAVYVDREIDDALDRAIAGGFNLVLLGERGSGKTTALNLAGYRLRKKIDLQLIRAADVEDAAGLVRRVADHVLDTRPPFVEGTPMRVLLQQVLDRATSESDNHDGERTRRLVFAVDGAPAEALWALFGAHRDDMWALGGQWIVTGDAADRAEILRPPADAFFNLDLTMGELSPAASRLLIERRAATTDAHLDTGELQKLIAVAGGNPRVLLQLVSQVIAIGGVPEDLARAEVERTRRAHALGRAASMLVAELANLGQASASDKTLLARLGWTRPRAAKIFKDLEEAGVVTSEQRRGEAGRPRKVFRLRTAAEFRDFDMGQVS